MNLEEVKIAVSNSYSYVEVCRNLNVRTIGGTYRKVRNFIISNKLDTTHFTPFKRKNTGGRNKIDLEKILVENSTYSGAGRIKRKLIDAGLKKDECEVCGQRPEWNGRPLVLQLDHINGVSDDNRLENLRVICPNCHTQTPTYVSKKGN